ncbi:GGDEF domain-containing protein [Wenzhouxiangella sp. XN201]|uniref:diguanylate cyclase n=1 Tax=Wenzhouxiangella sp. XN201 TaxID=2710755 RepID=UPI0013C6AD32|nr:GGDEF domain-containing protein [Wenzhouxiangella sp. XN201]
MSDRTGRHWLARLACALLLLAASAPLLAQHRADVIQLPDEGTIGDIKQAAAVRPDPEGALNPESLLRSDAGFERYSPELERNAPPLWLKLQVAAPPASDGQYVLRVARRFFQAFEVYVPDEDGQLREFRAAYDETITMDTVGRQFVSDFTVPSGEVQTLLIRVDTVQDSLQPVELWIESRSTFAESKTNHFLVFGLVFGMLIALIFHNFILYLNLRQRGHLFYVLAMASVLLLLGMDSGLLQNYVLPDFLLAYVAKLYAVINMLALVTIGLFFLAFVHPQRHAPRLSRTIRILIGVIALMATAALILPDQRLPLILTALQPVQLLFQILLIAGAYLAGRRGATEGYIFLAAWLVFIISGFARVFMSLDLVPRTSLFEYLIYFGSVVEASILALGLTWRVRQLYERHARAIEEQHKAARLANLDPLTDAYNRRFLQTYLDNVMPGASADSFDRAVLILDLDNFKETNDEYGHAAGDMVLRELVRRCQRVLREGDVICRLGGDEFVIVLSDQNDRTGQQVAGRIIDEVAERPFLFEGAEMPVTTSIGVVSSISPTCTVSDILRMADQALYQAKQAGRNRAVLFDPDKATPFRHGPSRAPARHEEA